MAIGRNTEVLQTEAGVRLIAWRRDGKAVWSRWKVSSLRSVPDAWFTSLDAAEAGFRAEVAASIADPKLGPIIRG